MKKTIGVIGLGSIGMRHAKNLQSIGYIVIGYDPINGDSPDILQIEAFISKQDAIVIASPTNLHYQHLLASMAYGKPTFIEKPIASEDRDWRDLHNYESTMKLFVGYNLRFHSCVKKAKEWIDAGRIGTPLWANFTLGQFSAKEPYLRDGVILNWSHELDLALYLLGPAVLTGSSTQLTDGKDDMTDILLTHKNGCRSTVHLDYVTNPEVRGFLIVGSNGRISCDVGGRVIDLWDAKIRVKRFCGEDSWNDNYIEEMQAFLDRIDGKDTIGCTGEEGLEVLKICLEVRKQAGL